MGECFDAIGFDLPSGDALDELIEYVGNAGDRTSIYRRGAFIHGRCLRLGGGLEVWAVLYETKQGLFYADCRPGYRSLRVYSVSPWELTEYDEDGGAVVTGLLYGTRSEVTFELQNLTELKPEVFQLPYLHVSLAGLAYRARAVKRVHEAGLTLNSSRARRQEAENDYSVRGPVVGSRRIRNEVTGNDVWLIDVDAGLMNLEVLVNRDDLQGDLAANKMLSANIWLQGHVLDERLLEARYEGLDRESTAAQYWSGFKRDN